jgi:hypothetical protein
MSLFKLNLFLLHFKNKSTLQYIAKRSSAYNIHINRQIPEQCRVKFLILDLYT